LSVAATSLTPALLPLRALPPLPPFLNDTALNAGCPRAMLVQGKLPALRCWHLTWQKSAAFCPIPARNDHVETLPLVNGCGRL
jgi:hypothetical protein